MQFKRMSYWIYVCFLTIFCLIINVPQIESKKLNLFVLNEEIIMPFPKEPDSIEPIVLDGIIYYAYIFSDQELGMAYSATIIKDSNQDNLSAKRQVSIFLDGHAFHQKAKILKKEELSIDGRVAGYITTHRERRSLIVRSNVIAIYDEGNFYTWEVQGAPRLVDDLVDQIFFENIKNISFLK